MADVDIDPFGEHESRSDDNTQTGENIPFTPVGGRSTWNQTEERKQHHLEKNLRELNSGKIMLEIYIKGYLKTLVKPQNYFTMIILNSKMENCTTEAVESP